MTNFGLYRTVRVCRRQFQMDDKGRKISKRVENTVGKGEIARDEQFLFFPLFFQNVHRKHQGLFGKGLRHTGSVIVSFDTKFHKPLYHTILASFNKLEEEAF